MSIQRTPLMDISNNDVTSTPVATASRRKSGRAIHAPEKFVPDLPSSQAGKSSAKRKRTGEGDENDASDVDEEEEEGEEEDDESEIESPEEEEVRPSRKKSSKPKAQRKPAAKRAKVNGAATNGEAAIMKLPSRPRPKKAGKKVAIADKAAEGLYAEVYTSGDSSADVAQQWLNRYKDNSAASMAELVNFMLRTAGCALEVTEDDINDADNIDRRIGDLQEEFQEQNITDYPLISKAKSSHAFRASLVGFFDQLIEAMHESNILYEDEPLVDNIHAWISSMSSSTTRPFRHTATLIALTIANALCRVASKQITTAAQVQRQLEAEKKKKSGNKARIADFQKKFDENERRRTSIENHLKDDYFTTVYMHRYRDVDPKIRTECVEALGYWILTLPSVFFDGQYLRYMGWMLSDIHNAMRHEVIKQLHKIMQSPSNHALMRHFIERFRPRLIEMATRDADPGVRASTVELMDLIRQAGMLEPDDIDVIGKLIFDAEPKVRKALVGFFAENVNDLFEAKIEDLGGEEALEDVLNVEDEEDYDTPRAGWIRFKCLAESLGSYDAEDQEEMSSQVEPSEPIHLTVFSDSESRFTLAAQALYEKVPDLKNWEMLAGYLLFDHTSPGATNGTERALRECFKPDDKEELILLEVLNAVVKMNITLVDDAHKSKEKSRNRLALEAQEAKESAARKLAGIIPKLLKKYGADPKTARVALRLEHVLNLGIFQELRQDSTGYAKWLDEISAQFRGHADRGVLTEAAAVLQHALGFEELAETTESKIQVLWEDAINTLQNINKAGEISVRGTFTRQILSELSNTLAKLERLAYISNPVEILESHPVSGGTLPITILLDVIARGVYEELVDEEIDTLEDEAVVSAIETAGAYMQWKVRFLTNSIEAGDDIPDLDIDHLLEWQEIFITNLTASFSSRSTLDPVRLVGAGQILTCHILFSTWISKTILDSARVKEDPNAYSYTQTLVKEIIPEVQAELTQVFESLEKSFARKSKKKLEEPDDDEAPEDIDDDPEEEQPEAETDDERLAEVLRAEEQLCSFTGKLLLAIEGKVIDNSGPLKGKLKKRLLRNKARLGPNFRDLVAYLEEKKKKSHKSKAQQLAVDQRKKVKSREVVEEEEEEEEEVDPFAEEEEDERRMDEELEEAARSPEQVQGGDGEGGEDEIMGD